jgi:hypothetical protein
MPKSGKQTFGLGYFFNGCANVITHEF